MNSNVTFNSKIDDGILFCTHDNQNKYYGKHCINIVICHLKTNHFINCSSHVTFIIWLLWFIEKNKLSLKISLIISIFK